MKWRIYYGDGTTRNESEGLPVAAAHHFGVMCVAQQSTHDQHFRVASGAEFYIFCGTSWVPVGVNGLEDWAMFKRDEIQCVIKGRAIDQGQFHEIWKKAKDDCARSLD